MLTTLFWCDKIFIFRSNLTIKETSKLSETGFRYSFGCEEIPSGLFLASDDAPFKYKALPKIVLLVT